ncbi:integrase catalytic domain-containing protein [Trichonephila clavipes]|uniref:Integrase catalytic domain-containing protein n=1 Tax=Trichonephila clavipes TaxID=2585209 RepID=A0A8X6VZ19_TRICX|nr:integrase catalytic domain-containing protein [Trichonephila clavipes]
MQISHNGHKHPILLPKRRILTDLTESRMLLHAGTQLVQSCIHEHYWIIGARDVIRHLIGKCIKCCKVRASITNQMMSDLSSSRISPAPAFMRCGIDYSGPFQIKIIKADAFIAAPKRFISRRGKCSNIYSDCGSNFVGAKRKLMEFEKLAKSNNDSKNVGKFLTNNGIKWHQNVPGAPHMGGLCVD